jgi:DNA-binding SARP family transcriptional activator
MDREADTLMAEADMLQFTILGPVDVFLPSFADRDGTAPALPLGPLKQRIVLALLLCHANEVVPTEQLLAALWPAGPPRTAAKNIQVYVSHLRRVLAGGSRGGGRDRIVYRPPGYRIAVRPDELDAAVFEELVRAGRVALRQARPEQAAALLRAALDTWRGPALNDLRAAAPALRAAAIRYDDRRLAAAEDWIEAELTLGHHAEVIDDIERLVQDHPLRERLRGEQLVALYRCGRQVEALAEYDNLRRALAGELGLTPSPALRRLYQSILAGEVALAGAAPSLLGWGEPESV